VRSVGLEWQVTRFVDDQQPGLGIEARRSSSWPSACAMATPATSAGGGDEQYRVALADRLSAERDGQMRLPKSQGSATRSTLIDEAHIPELAACRWVAHSGKVEAVELAERSCLPSRCRSCRRLGGRRPKVMTDASAGEGLLSDRDKRVSGIELTVS
jgi:hypothetical protein